MIKIIGQACVEPKRQRPTGVERDGALDQRFIPIGVAQVQPDDGFAHSVAAIGQEQPDPDQFAGAYDSADAEEVRLDLHFAGQCRWEGGR